MKLTRRGRVLVALLAVVILSGFLYGARGLNAVIVPGVVVLAVSGYQLHDLRRPEVDRELPARAERGETIPVRINIDSDSSLPAHVTEAVGEGLAATGNEWDVTLDQGTLAYDLTLLRRGERTVGPLTIEVRDLFGLVSRTYRYRSGDPVLSRQTRRQLTDALLIRPRVYSLAGPAQTAILGLYGSIGDERQEFDHLRDYRRGDPLKDVHWKSSAKYPDEDFVVKEFTADEDADTLTIGVEALEATVDLMADAGASIAADLIEAEVAFELVTATRRIDGDTESARQDILDHLARVDPGRLDDDVREEADLLISGDAEVVWVEIDGRRYEFPKLVGGIEEPLPDTDSVDVTNPPTGESAS